MPRDQVTNRDETLAGLIRQAARDIGGSSAVDLWRPSDARTNAEELMEAVIHHPVEESDLRRRASPAQRKRFEAFVTRRVAGEPVAMIVGHTEFLGLDLIVRQGVFVPRASSELLARKAIDRLRSRARPVAVDVATGTGPVALGVASRVKAAKVFGLDISSRPLAVARLNAQRLGLRNVEFRKSDLLSGLDPRLKRRVDVFTLHPPYVAHADLHDLPAEIVDWEPVESLTDRSHDGLELVRRLASESESWLRPGGSLLVEVSPNLSRMVKSILVRNGLERARSLRDDLGATRVIVASSRRKRP